MSFIAPCPKELSFCIRKMNSFSLRILSLLTICIFTLFHTVQSEAQQQKIGTLVLDADSMIRDGRNQIIRLEKNVQVIFDGQHLKADKASIDLKTKTIHAEGNLTLVSAEAKIEAERISMEYEKNTGV